MGYEEDVVLATSLVPKRMSLFKPLLQAVQSSAKRLRQGYHISTARSRLRQAP